MLTVESTRPVDQEKRVCRGHNPESEVKQSSRKTGHRRGDRAQAAPDPPVLSRRRPIGVLAVCRVSGSRDRLAHVFVVLGQLRSLPEYFLEQFV